MLKRIVFVFFVLAQGAMLDTAWGANRDAEVRELMQALQFDAQLKEMHEQVQQMLDQQTADVLAQFRKSAPNLDAQAMKELNAAMQTFVQRVMNSWDPDEAARTYGNILIEGMSDKQLKATIAHYRTPDGQQQLKVIRAATQSMNAYIMQNIQAAMKAALPEYVAELRAAMVRQRERWKAAGQPAPATAQPAPAAEKK